MNKFDFYFEMAEVIKMTESILTKFYNDMVEKKYTSYDVSVRDGYFAVYYYNGKSAHSNDIKTIVKDKNIALCVLDALKAVNNYNDMGWGPYLTALNLGLEKLNALSKENEE